MSHTKGQWTFDGKYIYADEAPIVRLHPGAPNFEDNARLMTASPELLEALKELVERFVKAAVLAGTDKEFAEVAVREYRELIAKATEGAK